MIHIQLIVGAVEEASLSAQRLTMSDFETSDGVLLPLDLHVDALFALMRHYDVYGDGRPLVFLPAWCQPAELYRDCLALDGMKCYVLDHRAHGKSAAPGWLALRLLFSPPGYGYRLSRLAKDLKDFLDHLDLTKVVLAGHSMGCAVIWPLRTRFCALLCGLGAIWSSSALHAYVA